MVERSALDRILSEQELQLSGVADAKGAVAVDGLANAGFSVVFHDKAGKEPYRLDSVPVTAFALGKGVSSFGECGPFGLVEAAPRDGWACRPDGKVEVQARALRDLAGLKVVPRLAAYSKRVSLPSAGEARWKSLVLHAYASSTCSSPLTGIPARR